eukprot:gnl/MRDRNA2_/MRDRNA2_14807_c0_seq1.p1 gnl/MRDRNA2_/MRDRNA2_14807_c0~~gnl/MRDRNA2_/MRDRNA2_14807_c0_seq1.p1  ORF type:complete len:403 (+),score=62.82 gnl/MRDRNA2_/MRDRNA2_14807_c0_seq1:94-1209(+)
MEDVVPLQGTVQAKQYGLATFVSLLTFVVSIPLILVFILVRNILGILLYIAEIVIYCTEYKLKAVRPGDGYALITGASSGIGMDIAKQLAKRGHDLVLVARRVDKLESLAAELRKCTRKGGEHIVVRVVQQDLAKTGSPTELFAAIQELNLDISILVNNAGVSSAGVFVEVPVDQLRKVVYLNVEAQLELTHIFTKLMVPKGRGHVMNVSSIAGFGPGPTEATYHATKAFVTSMSRAVNHELRGTGVSVTALCPGFTATEFFEAAGVGKPFGSRLPLFLQSSSSCAAQGLKAMFKGRSVCVAGTCMFTNALLVAFLPMLPEAFAMWFINFVWHDPAPKKPTTGTTENPRPGTTKNPTASNREHTFSSMDTE